MSEAPSAGLRHGASQAGLRCLACRAAASLCSLRCLADSSADAVLRKHSLLAGTASAVVCKRNRPRQNVIGSADDAQLPIPPGRACEQRRHWAGVAARGDGESRSAAKSRNTFGVAYAWWKEGNTFGVVEQRLCLCRGPTQGTPCPQNEAQKRIPIIVPHCCIMLHSHQSPRTVSKHPFTRLTPPWCGRFSKAT